MKIKYTILQIPSFQKRISFSRDELLYSINTLDIKKKEEAVIKVFLVHILETLESGS